MLIGLDRERKETALGGLRTFPLICLSGYLAGTVSGSPGGLLVSLGLLGILGLTVLANVLQARTDRPPDPGLTTEVAVAATYLVGVGLSSGHTTLAIVAAGSVAALLYWKKPLHQIVKGLDANEVRALMRLALFGLVILPLLPDRGFGPYDVLNPFRAWLLVVLIVGISLAAYVAQRVLGSRAGIFLTGILGGLISSTATTVSYSRRSAEAPDNAPAASLVLMLASTVVMGRVVAEVWFLAPHRLTELAPPLLAVGAWMVVVAGVYSLGDRAELRLDPDQEVPSPLGVAMAFAAIYLVVLLGSAAAKEYLGSAGVYAVALVSGLTDVDAITLSAVQMLEKDLLDPATTWRVILVGTLSNLAFKLGTAWVLGTRRLAGRVTLLFLLSGLAGVAVLLWW